MKRNKKIALTQKNGPVWLGERHKYIGGSDIAAIAGISPWGSPYSVWADKLGLYKKTETQAMHLGTILEQVVADLFTEETGIKVRKSNFLYVDGECEYFMANIDRTCSGVDAILECKTTSAFNKAAWDDTVPPYYYAQVQWYMGILGHAKAYVACLIGGQDFVVRVVERDDKYIEELRHVGYEFWTKHVLPKVQPELTDYDKNIVREMHPLAVPDTSVQLGAEAMALIEQKAELEALVKAYKKDLDAVDAQIMDLLKDNERGVIPGEEVVINFKNKTSRRFSSTDFKKAYPDLYAEFCKDSVSRTLEVKKNG